MSYIDNIYWKPWARAPPYFIGILTGWFLHRSKKANFKPSSVSKPKLNHFFCMGFLSEIQILLQWMFFLVDGSITLDIVIDYDGSNCSWPLSISGWNKGTWNQHDRQGSVRFFTSNSLGSSSCLDDHRLYPRLWRYESCIHVAGNIVLFSIVLFRIYQSSSFVERIPSSESIDFLYISSSLWTHQHVLRHESSNDLLHLPRANHCSYGDHLLQFYGFLLPNCAFWSFFPKFHEIHVRLAESRRLVKWTVFLKQGKLKNQSINLFIAEDFSSVESDHESDTTKSTVSTTSSKGSERKLNGFRLSPTFTKPKRPSKSSKRVTSK